MQNSKFQIPNSRDGIAALPAVVIIAGIALLVALAILGSGIIESLVSSSQKESGEAFYKAEAGTKDALERIARNPGFSSGTACGASSGYYPIPSDTSICVIVQKNTFSSPCTASSATGKTCIISTGTIKGKTRKIQVVVNLQTCLGSASSGNACSSDTDCNSVSGACQITGKIAQESWVELTQ